MSSEPAKLLARAAAWLTVALFVLTFVSLAPAQAGFVKDIEGKWLLDGRPLKRGQALPAGGRITFDPSGGPRGFITLGDNNARTTIHQNCEKHDECKSALIVPDSVPEEPSFVGEIVEIVRRRWFQFNRVVGSAISRTGALKDAVVRVKGSKVDLSPAFANMRRGQYLLRFVPKSRKPDAIQDAALKMVTFNWTPETLTTISVAGLTPGTYEVQFLSPEDKKPLEPGTEGWILVANAADYERARCAYMQALAITSQWGEDTRAETVRDFHRTYLEYLGQPGQK